MATLFETDFIIQTAQGQNNSLLAIDEWAKNETFQNDLERITEPAAQTVCFLLAFALGAFSALLSKSISAPFERVKMIMQCIDNEVKSTEVPIENQEDDINNSGRPSRVVTRVMASIKREHKKESQKRTNKKVDKVENCDEFNGQSKCQNDTISSVQTFQTTYGDQGSQCSIRKSGYGTANKAFEYIDIEETDFDDIWKEQNPETVSSNSSDSLNSAFEVTSFTKCVKHIYKTQGLLSFWNGNFANCLRYIPKFAIDMALKPYLYQMCELFLPITGDDVNLGYIFLANWIAGSIAAMTSSIICYPLDFARTRLATDLKEGGEFTGIIDCWRSTVRNHGFLALYAGMVPNLVGEVVYRGLKYCLYDFIQYVGEGSEEFQDFLNLNIMIQFLYDWILGWIVSCVSGTLSMPFDTIKRVMMKDTEEKQFGSMISCGRHLIKTYGFMRLFRGTVGNLLRFWSSGLALALNDMLQDVIYDSLEHLHCQ